MNGILAIAGPIALATLTFLVPLGIYLYVSLRIEMRVAGRRTLMRAEWELSQREWVAELEALRNRLSEAEARLTPSAMADQPLNLNRHGQILRLFERGRTAGEISADLQISQGEVDLFLKMQEWSGTGRQRSAAL